MENSEVIAEIKRQCGTVRKLSNGWLHFVYQHLHFVGKPDNDDGMIRMSIPYVDNINAYPREVADAAINETNREVKYIKVVVLNNGSISLNYDHKINNEEKCSETVAHMITTLYAASEYLNRKLTAR